MSRFLDLANLSGRRALVTGGAGHIGYAAAETLAELGATVVISDLPESDGLAKAARLSQAVGRTVSFIPADLGNEGEIGLLVETARGSSESIDIIVHAAALVGTSKIPGWSGSLEEQSLRAWKLGLDINLTSAFLVAKNAAPYLKKSSCGSVVLLSSIYGFLGPDLSLYLDTDMTSPAAYFASKGGIEQLCKWLACTLGPTIRVNALCPGGVERDQPQIFKDRYCAKTPLQRMATEDDLRGAIGFLCSDLSRYVTGQRIVVDGGLSAL